MKNYTGAAIHIMHTYIRIQTCSKKIYHVACILYILYGQSLRNAMDIYELRAVCPPCYVYTYRCTLPTYEKEVNRCCTDNKLVSKPLYDSVSASVRK